MTRAVILAAGFGSRLMPLTSDRPKGMVCLVGLPLLARQVAVLRAAGITDISLVGGYLSDRLESLGLPIIPNPAYETTNMVESLMCARDLMTGREDLLMVYGDIVFEPRVLDAVLRTEGEVVVAADREWRRLWSARMEDFSADVETFRLRADGCVAELGKRPEDLDDVEAQYIGLVRFSAESHDNLLAFYDDLDRTASYDGQPFPKMYMTSFIQQLIYSGWHVRPAHIDNGWLEVDTLDDLHRYEALEASVELASICRLEAPPEPDELHCRLVYRSVDSPAGICDIVAVAASLLDGGEPGEETIALFDRLARKIEIAGVLNRQYSLADMAVVEQSGLAAPDEAAALLAAFLVAFDRTGDRRHLNTVLKAIGGTLRQPRISYYHELDLLCARRLGEYG